MKIPPGISQREIADLVGVSVSTVSRALNDNSRISRLTKEAVRQAAEELARRRQDRNGHGQTAPLMLGLTHSHLSSGPAVRSLDTILEQVLGGMEVACMHNGYIPYSWQQSRLLLGDEGTPFFQAVSGVIMSGGLISQAVLSAILDRGKPVVVIGGHAPERDVPSIAADSERGAYLATRHLIELGHRRIALINGPAETHTSFEKRAGYLGALIDSGIIPDLALIRSRDGYTGFDAPVAEALTHEALDASTPPTAIVYAADHMAAAGYRVCQRRGLRVPDDISIAGFHDDPDARYVHPAMTTVRVNRALWGEVAVLKLLRLIGGEPMRGDRLLLPVELVIRQSTGPVRQ